MADSDLLIRASFPATFELRDADGDEDGEEGLPVMVGHFARFNEWTEIDSIFEGRFLERIAPGAFRKTFRENRDEMRVLFQHGRDPQIGMKVLGSIEELREDEEGAWYEVPLLDTSYVRDLLPGLRSNLYGASFKFRVMREETVEKPKRTDENPEGIPERTLKELRLYEFGPVTFPAYANATAGIRSLTDEFLVAEVAAHPDRLAQIATYVTPEPSSTDGANTGSTTTVVLGRASSESSGTTTTPPASEPSVATTRDEPPPSETETREERKDMEDEGRKWTIEERERRLEEIKTRRREIDREFAGDSLSPEAQVEWDNLGAEFDRHEKAIADQRARNAQMEAQERAGQVEREQERPGSKVVDRGFGGYGGGPSMRIRIPSDPFDIDGYRALNQPERVTAAIQQGAREILERDSFPHPDANREDVQAHVERLLLGPDRKSGELARRIVLTGSELYHRAFSKKWAGEGMTTEEERALSLTTTAGGFAVPYQLDPTIIPTSNGSVNPFRQIARIESITTNEWRGVTSDGVTAAYGAEANEAGDDAPTIAQPTANPERADVFIPFSFEIGMDWAGLQSEMARLVQDAKDDLEASKFVTGVGHAGTEPEGLHTGATAIVQTAAATTFAVADLYALEAALPPRFLPRASFVAARRQYQRVRQFDTQGGANLWVTLGDGLRNARTGALGEALLGYPTYEASAMSTALTQNASIFVIGDFSHFLIVDRIGMQAELLPNLLGSNRRPTGQRGLFFWWRNTSDVLAWQAFRTLKVT